MRFADGSALPVRTVVWTTGFRSDDSWIAVPTAKDGAGRIVQRRGVTPAPGLVVLGRPWQHTTGSALLGFVGRGPAHLADHLAT